MHSQGEPVLRRQLLPLLRRAARARRARAAAHAQPEPAAAPPAAALSRGTTAPQVRVRVRVRVRDTVTARVRVRVGYPNPDPSPHQVRGEGGSSSGHATTYLADNTEWSATGRMGVSLAGVAALNDAAFAQRRAASRLQEMIGSAAWGRVRGSSLGSRGAAAYAAAAAESGGGAES